MGGRKGKKLWVGMGWESPLYIEENLRWWKVLFVYGGTGRICFHDVGCRMKAENEKRLG